ncbi:MAG: hypothetical protein ACPLZD_05180 [Candidatus Saccharicenans sp.]|nr:MAG: hypothetical protein C0168_03405 [Candidatus Aminicenantes bacterium]HEK86092.1 hypothetical protein [Candidatus Aminicenantes bacterium]
MEENIKGQKKEKVFQLTCPYCGARLWVDSELQQIIQSEKGAKKKASFDELLLKEKKKTEELGQKFESTVELRKKKLEQAKAEFEKALARAGTEAEEEEEKEPK